MSRRSLKPEEAGASFYHRGRLLASAIVVPTFTRADALTEWNERALTCTTTAKQLPVEATRTMATLHVAIFDAVNSIEGRHAVYKTGDLAIPATSSLTVNAFVVRSVFKSNRTNFQEINNVFTHQR